MIINPYAGARIEFFTDGTWDIYPEEYEVEISDANGNKAGFYVDVDFYGIPRSVRLWLQGIGPLPLFVLAAGEIVLSEPTPLIVIGILGLIAATGLIVAIRWTEGGTQEAYPGTRQDAIEVYHDPEFRGEIPLYPGNEKYGWEHIRQNHPEPWSDEKLGIVDPNADPATQDQQAT